MGGYGDVQMIDEKGLRMDEESHQNAGQFR